MRNISFFDTPFGIASLVLKEIPYSACAYITVQSALDLDKLLEECVSFCRIVGAEKIYATGSADLSRYPLWMQVLQMQASTTDLGATSAKMEQVSDTTITDWIEIYNRKMAGIDNASYMTQRDGKEMLSRGDGYFVCREGERLGILMAADGKLHALASVTTGGGVECMRALAKNYPKTPITLEVASTNHKAIHLYKSLDFAEIGVVSSWYKIY
jgi:hypothetical protein